MNCLVRIMSEKQLNNGYSHYFDRCSDCIYFKSYYFDEYDVKKLYVNNPNLIYEMIINGLSEEYSIETINENLKVIEKTFLQVAKNKEVPNSINNIAHELVEKYPNENITDLMRIFAREYPFYKSESSLLFGVLKVIKNV